MMGALGRLRDHPLVVLCREGTMNFTRRRLLHLAACAAALPDIGRAQAYPSRPITLIVPFAAGGGADAIGRIVTERMRASLSQPFVIEIVAGANGSIGIGRAVHAASDGYTLCI
jgi:tripartite-type tricarboxylate transporter receptor subunit TctC